MVTAGRGDNIGLWMLRYWFLLPHSEESAENLASRTCLPVLADLQTLWHVEHVQAPCT